MFKDRVFEGKYVRLEEVKPKYFTDIIEWRNNPNNNKFLNQPFVLTMELQRKWYEEKYLNDSTQGLFLMIDNKYDKPFGTIGWTDYDVDSKVCIGGRLLVGEHKYRGGIQWREATLLFNQFIYLDLKVDTMFAHVVNNNIASLKWHKKWAFKINDDVRYPEELYVNGMMQFEYYRTYKMYLDFLTRRI